MTSAARPTAEAAQIAPDPSENSRQAAPKDYRIGSSPERTFDHITALASKVLGVPMAFISFLDRDTQFFKSCFGLDVREMPSEGSFCSYAAKGNEIMVVSDARSDPRFAHHLFVAGESRTCVFTPVRRCVHPQALHLAIPRSTALSDRYYVGALCKHIQGRLL